jgi:ankyrin repeat protein
MVKLLLAAGADANVLVGSRTVLHWAAEEGHQDIAEILVVSGADVNAHELNYGKTPAEFAMAKDHSEIAKMLIDKGAHIPPLHFTLYMKDRDKARSLIQEGADVNGRTSYGTAPLHVAVSSMLEQLVALLINEGADVNARAQERK